MKNKYYPIHHKYIKINGSRIFYREAGNKDLPTLLLLHGFPTSSFQFRELIPLLADQFHIIAPDFPGFGFTEAVDSFKYSFDSLAQILIEFIDALELNQFIMYVFDYGAPIGLRMAMHYPEKVSGFISQNGNAYIEGLADAWDPIRKYWEQPSIENRQNVKDKILTLQTTCWQYTHGVENVEKIAPETYFLDTALFMRTGNEDIQLDLFLDYVNNLELYPKFQAFFRKFQPRSLIIWGKNDPFFLPQGAEAFQKDNPHAVVKLLNTGHFALETHVEYIADSIRELFGN